MKSVDLDTLADTILRKGFVELEASGRHVHLTKAQSMALFGHLLTPAKELSQPGQFAAKERVKVTGPKGTIANVAVLGPERKEAQVEISKTDGIVLGITAPVRMSGDVAGTPGAVLESETGSITIDHGVIVARRHIHLTPTDAAHFGVADGQVVHLQTMGERAVTFSDTVVRISPDFAPRAHLDYDEANACGFRKGDFGRILP